MLTKGRGLSTPVIVGIVVVVLVVGAVAAYFTLQSGGPPSTSTTTQASTVTQTSKTTTTVQTTAAVNGTTLFLQHMQTVQSRAVEAITGEYASDAVVVWSGVTAGLGGTYSGTGNIRLLYAAALGTAQTINIDPSNISVKNTASGVVVNASLRIKGASTVLGPYNGTITSSETFVSSGGTWKIGHESWNFVSFFTSNEAGATTFPEWQRVGEPIGTNRSPDWFHNFAWDYGGPGAAVLIWALVVVLAGTVVYQVLSSPKKQSSMKS